MLGPDADCGVWKMSPDRLCVGDQLRVVPRLGDRVLMHRQDTTPSPYGAGGSTPQGGGRLNPRHWHHPVEVTGSVASFIKCQTTQLFICTFYSFFSLWNNQLMNSSNMHFFTTFIWIESIFTIIKQNTYYKSVYFTQLYFQMFLKNIDIWQGWSVYRFVQKTGIYFSLYNEFFIYWYTGICLNNPNMPK